MLTIKEWWKQKKMAEESKTSNKVICVRLNICRHWGQVCPGLRSLSPSDIQYSCQHQNLRDIRLLTYKKTKPTIRNKNYPA